MSFSIWWILCNCKGHWFLGSSWVVDIRLTWCLLYCLHLCQDVIHSCTVIFNLLSQGRHSKQPSMSVLSLTLSLAIYLTFSRMVSRFLDTYSQSLQFPQSATSSVSLLDWFIFFVLVFICHLFFNFRFWTVLIGIWIRLELRGDQCHSNAVFNFLIQGPFDSSSAFLFLFRYSHTVLLPCFRRFILIHALTISSFPCRMKIYTTPKATPANCIVSHHLLI